jgi:putative oxidoreductase
MSLGGVAGILEFVGGLLLVVGFLTRPVALVLAGEMLTAAMLVHLPRGGWPIENGGELALLYAVVFLFFVGNGAGSASVESVVWPEAPAPKPRPLARPPFEPRRSGW